jgi:hypothetical protein
MERYDVALRNAAIDVIEAVEYMEDLAREIAYDFDVPYSTVKEDLQIELNEWDVA